MAPKVSVIVPIYNVKQYLKAMLDSVSDQKMMAAATDQMK